MEGFESMFFEPSEGETTAEGTIPEEAAPETIGFKHDHRQLQLPLSAVSAIGEILGRSPEDTVATLQKGCNYDRLLKKAESSTGTDIEKALHTEKSWLELFMQERDLSPDEITPEMFSAVEDGKAPREVLLEMRLQRANEELAAHMSHAAAAAKSTGTLADALPESPKDDFERAFEAALKMY